MIMQSRKTHKWTKHNGMRHLKPGLAMISLLALALGLGGCGQSEAPAGEQQAVESTSVEAYGVVKSSRVLDVVLEFPAKLEALSVKEGEKLSKGQTIAQLNLADYRSQIDAKLAALGISQNEKTALLSEHTVGLQGDPGYQKLKDALELAEKSLAQAEADFSDAKGLLGAGAISQAEHDRLKLYYEQQLNAKKNIESDITQYEKGKKGVDSSVAIKDLQTDVAKDTVALMQSKLSANFMNEDRVICPFENAVVYQLGYEEGALINSAQKLCTLADLDALLIEADVTEDFIAEVKLGAAVAIVPVADRTRTYHGKVSRIADMAKVDNGETLISIEIELTDNDGFLKPNYNVDLSIEK